MTPPRRHPVRIRRPNAPLTPERVDRESLVLLGAALGAFGVKGEVKVRPFTAEPEGVVAYGALYAKDGARVLTPKAWRAIKDGLAVSAPEVPHREAAEALRGTGLHVPRDLLPPAEEDEFYHVDLLGCRVEALDGAALGEVVAVHDFGAGDLLLIHGSDGRQSYLPFTKAAAPIVDVKAKRIVADPPPEGTDEPTPNDGAA